MNKHLLCTLVGLICLTIGLRAEDRWEYIDRPNEIRIGWGDQLFESLAWHNPTSITTTMPTTATYAYKEHYRHNQHIWVEYQRRFKHWFSFGGMIDMSEVGWDIVTRDGRGTELTRNGKNYFYNIVIMPTVRFTYFHHPNVNLYSGLGVGIDINGGTETDAKGRHTAVGAAVNFTVFGVSANYRRWFASVECGGMYALRDMNTVYMLSSRIIAVGVGARF